MEDRSTLVKAVNFVQYKTGDIEVGFLWDEFLKEMQEIPIENGYKNVIIKQLFKPSHKGYTHRLYRKNNAPEKSGA